LLWIDRHTCLHFDMWEHRILVSFHETTLHCTRFQKHQRSFLDHLIRHMHIYHIRINTIYQWEICCFD
jgi:hypothetical protein